MLGLAVELGLAVDVGLIVGKEVGDGGAVEVAV
jgi:hypothetical protein